MKKKPFDLLHNNIISPLSMKKISFSFLSPYFSVFHIAQSKPPPPSPAKYSGDKIESMENMTENDEISTKKS